MSDVDVVRRGYAAWNERDEAALVALFAADAEVHSALARAEGSGVFRGHDGVRRWFRDNIETVGFVMEPSQFLSFRGHVLSLVVVRAHAHGSGVAMPQEYGLIHTVRGGLIVRVLTFLDPAEAIEAMGRLTRR
jgi:ketosteroid isomerase-like protein